MRRPARRLLHGNENTALDYSGNKGGKEKWIDLDMFLKAESTVLDSGSGRKRQVARLRTPRKN